MAVVINMVVPVIHHQIHHRSLWPLYPIYHLIYCYPLQLFAPDLSKKDLSKKDVEKRSVEKRPVEKRPVET